MSRGVKALLVLLGALVALGAVAAFVFFGPPAFAEQIAQPEFCARCHVMKPQYAAFQAGTHAGLESCNDCHLPNDNFVEHWFWDGVVGVRDLVKFNLNIIPEHIEARERSRGWIEENCRDCHAEVISEIHPPPGRRCWECHRDQYHDFQTRFDPEQRRPSWREGE